MHFTLCDYVFEIVQNAVESGASRVNVICEETPEACRFVVEDNGCGMTEEETAACHSPFVTDARKHPNRKVGLGIPFMVQCIEAVGGQWNIDSKPGRGTRMEAVFPLRHLDTPPLGSLEDLWVSAMGFEGEFDLVIERKRLTENKKDKREYSLDRKEISAMLGDLRETAALLALRQFVQEQETALRAP